MPWRPPVIGHVLLLVTLFLLLPTAIEAAPRSGTLELRVIDADSGVPLACRMHLKNDRGRPRKAPKTPFFEDHFVFRSPLQLTLREGNYTFEVECGPEYHTQTGHFTMERGGTDTKTLKMKRFVDMAKEGWWAGDFYVHRQVKDIDLLMQAEDLHLAQVVTWSDQKNELERARDQWAALTQRHAERQFEIVAGRDSRKSGGLAVFPLASSKENFPPDVVQQLAGSTEEYPPGLVFAQKWRAQGPVWIDAESPTVRDLPVWVALGLIDSVRLAHHRYTRSGIVPQESSVRPRDDTRYAGTVGLGRWSDHVYYQLLECGLRIPPTAGSGSGDVDSPPGHNRVYVHCEHAFSPQKWWQGLRAGQVVVTNGPLLRARIEGQLPGHIFQGKPGETLRLQPEVQLSAKEKLDYLEVVKNGQLIHSVALHSGRGGKLPALTFTQSGWMLIRVRSQDGNNYRFATTGPFYVEFEGPRISRTAARFFADWVAERAADIKFPDPQQQREVHSYHAEAEKYWQEKIEQANAE